MKMNKSKLKFFNLILAKLNSSNFPLAFLRIVNKIIQKMK